MKRLPLYIILLTICSIELNAQEANMWPDSVIYVTPEDEVHLRDKDTKYLVKIGSDISMELKVAKALSFEIELIPDQMKLYSSTLNVAFGFRYYYQMADRINTGKQANNLSGNYISILAGIGDGEEELGVDKFNSSASFSLGVGTQQRYLQDEYFDFGLFLDYDRISIDQNNSTLGSFTLRTESNYGFVFGKKHEINKENLCPVIKCFQDRKSGWKVNRNDLFVLSRSEVVGNDPAWYLRLKPNIGFEYKIGNSAFTIDQEIEASLVLSNYGEPDQNFSINKKSFGLKQSLLTYNVSGRYYYRMKKKILSGEQGNNLTGSYAYAKYRHIESNADGFKSDQGAILLGIGQQTKITGPLYLDAKLGIGPVLYGAYNPLGFLTGGNDVAIELDFAIGYMF